MSATLEDSGSIVGRKFSVLNHGHVILVDSMGCDADVVDAARTSYKKGTRKVSDDETLLRYLMRSRHSTPFESCVLKFHVKLPVFVERQFARHRTAGWSEVSARYSELPDEFYVPDCADVCVQSGANRQGRGDSVSQDEASDFILSCDKVSEFTYQTYQTSLNQGLARELSRINLPVSIYTEKVWWINLHNMLHLLGLRMDGHAQKEIRVYADAMGAVVAELFPQTWKAFLDYRFHAVTLSRLDVNVIASLGPFRPLTSQGLRLWLQLTPVEGVSDWTNERCRERDECFEKLKRLNLVEQAIV